MGRAGSKTKAMINTTLLSLALCFCSTFCLQAADSSDLAKMQGNWEVKTTSSDGDKITQRLEVNKDKLIFKVLDASRAVRLYATAKLKTEKIGTFNVLKVTEIQAGDSEADMSPVDDDRSPIYQLRDGKLILVSNLEKERDDMPRLDIYEKVSK
jgi:hypothetical protein